MTANTIHLKQAARLSKQGGPPLYHAAKKCYANAKQALKEVRNARKAFQKLMHNERIIVDKYEGDLEEAYDELEPLYIRMEGADFQICSAYGPYLENIALTHILCTTTAEAYITRVAKTNLSRTEIEHFDKLSLLGKWLFLPRIMGKDGFDLGKQPFQSFSAMVSFRHKLIHYKEQKFDWYEVSCNKPKLPSSLGLSLKASRQSLQATAGMILMLSDMVDRERPSWLRPDYDRLPQDIVTNFFNIAIKANPSHNGSSDAEADA